MALRVEADALHPGAEGAAELATVDRVLEVVRVGVARGDHHDVLGGAEQTLGLEEALQLAQQEGLALRDRRGGIGQQLVDGLRERGEVQPRDPVVADVRDRGRWLRIWDQHEQPLLPRRSVEHREVLAQLPGPHRPERRLDLEEVVEARRDARVRHRAIPARLVHEAHHLQRRLARGGGEQPLDPPKSMRSSTARIDEVTRFSPWRYVENSGAFGILRPPRGVPCSLVAQRRVSWRYSQSVDFGRAQASIRGFRDAGGVLAGRRSWRQA